MSKYNQDKDVVCPYYRSDEPQTIFCEGAEDNSSIRLGFATRQQKLEYLRRNCRKFHRRCPVAYGLDRKWGIGDE